MNETSTEALMLQPNGTAELIDQVEVSDDMPSEVLKELLTCNGALKVCEAAKESMQKSIKCWMKGVEEKEAEYETQIGNLELTVQNLAQEKKMAEDFSSNLLTGMMVLFFIMMMICCQICWISSKKRLDQKSNDQQENAMHRKPKTHQV